MPELPSAGDDFAGYRILGILGKGRTSVVYQAGNPRLGNVIALKVLLPELAASDPFRTRFFEESRIAAALNHPHVIPVHDMGSAGGLLYIAMRQVTGSDLRRILTEAGGLGRDGGLDPARAVALLAQAARALDAAHRRGLVHRDVKPGNLLVETGDHLYLTDFGITKVISSRTGLTSPGEFLGTVDYIAPEQIRGISVTGLADQYSLACVLHECLTGRAPFRKDADAAVIFAHVEEMPPPPSAVRPGLPRAIDTVITRALAKQPGDRYASCAELMTEAARALETAVPRIEVAHGAEPAPDGGPGAGAAPAARPETPRVEREWEKPRSVRKDKSRKWPVLAALAVLTAGAGAGTWFGLHGLGPADRASQAARAMPAPSRTMPMPMPAPSRAMPKPAPSGSPLAAALAQANTITRKVPPARCSAQGSAKVTCLSPAPGVSQAVFRTYPSMTALYAAYESEMKSLDGGRVEQNTQDCGLTAPPVTGGETAWNHQFDHPHVYSIAQMETGKVGVAQAAGRVFCVLSPRSGLTEFVWTQDGGRLLGVVAGPLHEQVWYWWRDVHHEIALGQAPMVMPG